MADSVIITLLIEGLLSAFGNVYIVCGFFALALLMGFILGTDIPLFPSIMFTMIGYVLAVVAGLIDLKWMLGVIIVILGLFLTLIIIRLFVKT